MLKNIIIAVLVLSNFAFLVFAMYQKQMASNMAVAAQTNYMGRARMEEVVVAAQSELVMARQTIDSLRYELAEIQE